MSEDESSQIENLAEECAAKLMEHADSVRIFITIHTGDKSETFGYSTGLGNFQAQYGQIREWMIRQDERVKIHARSEEE